MAKECVLYDRECIDCGECDRCDLDPDKICDNCGKCIETDQEFISMPIQAVYPDKTEPELTPEPVMRTIPRKILHKRKED